jgi:hypothetical protein
VSLSDALEFGDSRSYACVSFVRLIAFKVGVDSGRGDTNSEGDLQWLEAFACEEDDAGEVLEVALDGCEGVIDVTGDFGWLFA